MAHDRQIVRDQQQAERQPPRQVDEEICELRLRGRVERRERLVEHEHRGVGRERTCDGDALPLPAAELVGKAGSCSRRQADELEQLLDAGLAPASRCELERSEPVSELRADLPARVQRRVRVLEDHLQARELTRPCTPGQRRHLIAFEDDAPCRRAH
jgi:hypothetical protein